MQLTDLVNRTRSHLRDFTGSVFRYQDIVDFLNEAIDRVYEVIPELGNPTYLSADTDVPNPIPAPYHSLLPMYAASRCYTQDDRPYQSITFSNEFEQKVDEFRMKFEIGRVRLFDALGNRILPFDVTDFVETNDYFYRSRTLFNTPNPSGGLDNNTVVYDNLLDVDGDDDVPENYEDISLNTGLETGRADDDTNETE